MVVPPPLQDSELAPLLALRDTDANHRDVEESLTTLGWTACGEGDWAIALRAPSGKYAARVSPFDPAHAYQVELYQRATGNRYFPRL
jgi:hypothetical protein